ncbi:hypothetical protein D3C71_1499040 [compost metagenome]
MRQPGAQRIHFAAVGGGAGLHLLLKHVAQLLVGVPCAAAPPQEHAQPQEQENAQCDGGPGQADLDGVGEQEQENHQGKQADRHEGAGAGQDARRPVPALAERAGNSGKET